VAREAPQSAPWTPLHDRLILYLNEYCLRWLPLVILAAFCLRDPRAVGLFVLHLALFRNGLTALARRD
jgi:hypothetical protein